MTNLRRLAPIILVTGIALVLRICGIDWGLPNALHLFSYHPDETVMLIHSTDLFDPQGLKTFAGQFLPHFYNYGSLQLVLLNIAISISLTYFHPTTGAGLLGQQLYFTYLVGRTLTASMGAATVWAVWALGRRLYSEQAGLAGALLLAVAPLHVQHSHFMTVDVPATLWVTLALLWCAKSRESDRFQSAILSAAVFTGLASATKYNCCLLLIPLLYSLLSDSGRNQHRSLQEKAIMTLAAGAAAAAAYLIGCPGTILEHKLFVRDVLFEARHVSSQQELWFKGTGIGWWYILWRNLGDGLGLPLLMGALAGGAYAVRKRSYGDVLTLSFALPYYLIVGAAVSRYARYEIPLLPFLTLWAGRLWMEGAELSPRWRTGALAAGGAVAAVTMASALFFLAPMLSQDPRDRAAEWLSSHLTPNNPVGVPVEPWFWTAPIFPDFAAPGDGAWRSEHNAAQINRRLVVNSSKPFDSNQLQGTLPEVVVMSEYEYFDRLRTHDRDASAYLDVLRTAYARPLVFQDIHWLGGRKTIDGLPCQDLPHDMLYPEPTVLIFRRLP